MSHENVQLVRRFFRSIAEEDVAGACSCFAEDASYELFVAPPKSVKGSFRGRAAVQEYLSVLPAIYQILHSVVPTIVVEGNETFARGSEIARLVFDDEIVRAEWVAFFQIEDGLIKKVTMSIYSWTILSGYTHPGLLAARPPTPSTAPAQDLRRFPRKGLASA